jgi:hypothetical protein
VEFVQHECKRDGFHRASPSPIAPAQRITSRYFAIRAPRL